MFNYHWNYGAATFIVVKEGADDLAVKAVEYVILEYVLPVIFKR